MNCISVHFLNGLSWNGSDPTCNMHTHITLRGKAPADTHTCTHTHTHMHKHTDAHTHIPHSSSFTLPTPLLLSLSPHLGSPGAYHSPPLSKVRRTGPQEASHHPFTPKITQKHLSIDSPTRSLLTKQQLEQHSVHTLKEYNWNVTADRAEMFVEKVHNSGKSMTLILISF